MIERVRYGALRNGLLIAIDGFALWFLGFLLAAYETTDALPWTSGAPVIQQASDFTRHLIGAPFAGPPEVLASVGLILVVVGPATDWILLPLLSRLGIHVPVAGSETLRNLSRRLRSRL